MITSLLAVAGLALAAGPDRAAAEAAPTKATSRTRAASHSAPRPTPGAPADPTTAAGPAATPPTPTHVEAGSIEYLNKERRTVMTGKPFVTMRRDDATLVCRRMVADNDEAGDISHAVCDGDVKLTRGEQVVTCQHATYDAPTATIVCRGDTVLKDGASVLHSTEVTYDIQRDRVLATNGKGVVYQRPGQKLPTPRERAR